MELRQLRYFVAVAEESHFGRAAQRLHMSQPPLSMQIKGLEAELGVELLNRSTRRVRLTDAGRAFLEQARAILGAVEEAQDAARGAEHGMQGQLHVGFISSATLSLLPPQYDSSASVSVVSSWNSRN
jgi:DNA-binding transcriptional LysR family regulator